MKKLIQSLLPDALMIMGASAISYGAWLIYQPAGYVVGGAFIMAAGILAARGTGE